MTSFLSVRRVLLGATLGVATTFVIHSSAVSAPAPLAVPFHVELLRSEPAVNETITAIPKQIKLWFSESIELKTTNVKLTNAKNEAVKLGKLAVDTAPLAPAIVDLPPKLAAGKYTVTWRAAGDDDHQSTGKYSFTVK
ncbi:MAG TPA: copper resistance protein CopC [Gemmatimonadaceae bacterium]|jgi:hypothetical protein